MNRISLLGIILASVLMTSCAPIPSGDGNNTPYDEENMGYGLPTLRDRDAEPYFFEDGSPTRPFDGHDNDHGRHHEKDNDRGRDHDSDHNRSIHRDFDRDSNRDFSIDSQHDQIQVHEVIRH